MQAKGLHGRDLLAMRGDFLEGIGVLSGTRWLSSRLLTLVAPRQCS